MHTNVGVVLALLGGPALNPQVGRLRQLDVQCIAVGYAHQLAIGVQRGCVVRLEHVDLRSGLLNEGLGQLHRRDWLCWQLTLW